MDFPLFSTKSMMYLSSIFLCFEFYFFITLSILAKKLIPIHLFPELWSSLGLAV